MKERPILFSGAMVRAILDGRKTQTRRVIKPQPFLDTMGNACWNGWNYGQTASKVPRFDAIASPIPTSRTGKVLCPYGKPGDRFWVREAWRVGKPHDQTPPRDVLPSALANDKGVTVLYEAGGWRSIGPAGREEPVYANDAPMPVWAGKRRPSMFMPRGMSRITLGITGVRVERLNDCNREDAIAGGIAPELDGWVDYSNPSCQMCLDPVDSYRTLWDSINGAGAWHANPWVWVIEFRRTA